MLSAGIATIHPEFCAAYQKFGVLKSALEKNLLSLSVTNIRDHAVDRHGSIDDRPYGGGDSMVMRPEPLRACVEAFATKPRVIVSSPSGPKFAHQDACRLALSEVPLLFICGRFAGMDQRFVDRYVDEEFSVGDFVVSGGELPVLLMLDAILRQVPGVLGNAASAKNDSFGEGLGGMLEYPLYTRPPVFEEAPIPPVLLSGDHAAIAAWRHAEARHRTLRERPELLR